jgi:hypothetical protein
MRFSKLLVFSALWLAAMGANAADLIERVAPESPDPVPDVYSIDRTPAEFKVGNTYVLFNKGAEKFWFNGNAWTTQATGSESEALIVRFVLPADLTLDDKALYLHNYVQSHGKWETALLTNGDGTVNGVYGDGTVALFVDNSDQPRNYLWVEAQGNNVYRLRISDKNPDFQAEGTWVGIDDNGPGISGGLDGTCIMPKLTEGEGVHVDWEFYALPEWDEYWVLQDVFNASEELKKQIEAGEAQGIDVQPYADVYNNEDATLEQINQAIAQLKDAIADAKAFAAFKDYVPGQVLDVSSLITNPNFDNNDLSGWSGSGWGAYNPKSNAERYEMNFNTYQVVSGLKPGLYVTGVNAFYRAGNTETAYKNFKAQNDESKYAKFYLKAGDKESVLDIQSPFVGAPTSSQTSGEASYTDEETQTTYYIPNNMVCAEYYMHTLGLYKNRLFIEVPTKEITIGFKKEKTVSADWVICDDFTLLYCGDGADGYQTYINYAKGNYPDYEAQRTDYDYNNLEGMGINFTTKYLDDFNAQEFTATNAEEVEAAMAAINAAHKPLEENIALWNEFKATAIAARNVHISGAYMKEYTEPLMDWVEMDAEDLWNSRAATNEELRTIIDEKLAEIAEAKKHMDYNGEEHEVDLLVNPDFEKGIEGWTRVAAAGGNVASGGTSTNTCYEAWNNSNFDIYQELKDAPAGIYRIEVQGFYRYGRGDNAWNLYQSQEAAEVKPGGAPVFVYMNSKATPFKNVFDEKVEYGTVYDEDPGSAYTDPNSEYWYPDQMNTTAMAFSAGLYKQSAYGIIKEGQVMRVGVKGNSSQLGDSWSIWDNFHLYNCGKDANAVMNVLPDEIEVAKALLEKPMAKSIYDALLAAVNAAEASIATGDGDTMFDALNDLFDAEENVNASIAIFAELETALNDLVDAMGMSANSAAKAEAQSLVNEISDVLAGHTIENSDVNVYLLRIKKMKTQLLLPAQLDGNDAAPQDLTVVIVNPTYIEGSDAEASNAGWSGNAPGLAFESVSYGNAEFFNANYDYYQEILGLPEGTYELRVQGYYRAGGAEADYTRKDSIEYSHAYFYAISGDSLLNAKPLARLASGASDWIDAVETDFVAAKTDTIKVEGEEDTYRYLQVANRMGTGADEFAAGKYKNAGVFVKVGADGYLRIGLKKQVLIADDWTLFDNWELYYYGNQSAKEATGNQTDVRGISEKVEPVAVEYYTLDGRKAHALQSGIMIQKTTLSNGAVVVRKVRK